MSSPAFPACGIDIRAALRKAAGMVPCGQLLFSLLLSGKIMNRLRLLPFLLLALAFSSAAQAAKITVGSQDSISHIADTKIMYEGKQLYLGHKKSMYLFGLPLYVKSDGLVFGVRGDNDSYMGLPDENEIREMQKQGLLPDPLPVAELTLSDYLWGYSLWPTLIALFLFYGGKRALSGSKNTARKEAEEKA
jgi:hypothetical protein